jgi:hypothetical protein
MQRTSYLGIIQQTCTIPFNFSNPSYYSVISNNTLPQIKSINKEKDLLKESYAVKGGAILNTSTA